MTRVFSSANSSPNSRIDPSLEPFLSLGQELSPALFAWNPYQGKLAVSIRAAYVLETRKSNVWSPLREIRSAGSDEPA